MGLCVTIIFTYVHSHVLRVTRIVWTILLKIEMLPTDLALLYSVMEDDALIMSLKENVEMGKYLSTF